MVRRALAAVALGAVMLGGGCSRDERRPPVRSTPDAATLAPAIAGLPGVVDPWRWPRARGASARERAIEDIGPWEPVDPTAPRSALVNANGHHWTRLVDLPWARDVVVDVKDEPVDLDGDGKADVRVNRRVAAPGGILANPDLFGLVRTPDDPRGRVGRVSASTGVLGLREAIDAEGRPTGMIGMTCWLCHGGVHPDDGTVVYGMAGVRFDYGLLLATSSLLDDDRVLDLDGDGRADAPAEVARRSPLARIDDGRALELAAAGARLDRDGDGRVTAGEFRRALGFPPGQTTRARLLLAGPGRQDLTAEFGLDLGVPGLHSVRHPGVARLRQRPGGVFNPVSVPPLFRVAGLVVQNWSASEDSTRPWLERLSPLTGGATPWLPADGDRALARRALLLDLRNLGTLGLQQDSYPALAWSDALRGRARLPEEAMLAIPALYALPEVRALAEEADGKLRRPALDPAQVARGRALFTERIVGVIANRQVIPHPAPPGPAGPALAPLDPTRALDARLEVRCADCHSAAPLERMVAVSTAGGAAEGAPPLGRCSHCHLGHGGPAPARAAAAAARRASAPSAEVAACVACHARHRAFGPVSYSSGWVLPFDADGDGNAQGDEAGDARAGGIGTEPLLAFDVPRAERPGGRLGVVVPVLADARRPGAGPVGQVVTTGVAWVRVAPLVGVFATAPYLHNGSVPTLEALLDPAARRPAQFSIAAWEMDARVPGNGNRGHEFGTHLRADEKRDLVAFLRSL